MAFKTFRFNVWLVVLLTIQKLNLTWGVEVDIDLGLLTCKGKGNPRHRIDAFDETGYVRIEVSGIPYVIKGGPKIVEGFYRSGDFPGNATTNRYLDQLSDSEITRHKNYPKGKTVLSLETSELHNVSSHTFKWMSESQVHSLILRNTDIEDVADDTLEPVQNSLVVLDISNASISVQDLGALMKGLKNESVETSSSLIILSMAKLGLESVPYDALKPVQYSLRGLSLFGNYFQTTTSRSTTEMDTFYDEELDVSEAEVETSENLFADVLRTSNTSSGSSWAKFPRMPYLLELDLRDCHIDFIGRGTFANLGNLQRLFLSQNHIFVLPNFAFEGLRQLSVLDLSSNKPSTLNSRPHGLILQSNSFADLTLLRTINLSYTHIRRKSLYFLTRLPQSLNILNLCQTGLVELTDGVFEKLSNLHVLDLSYNPRLGEDLTVATFSGLNTLSELYLARTSLKSLAALKELNSLKILDAQRNNLNNFEDLTEKFLKLELLDVSFNYINSWREKKISRSKSNLHALFLHSNILSLMSEEMIHDFKSVSRLTLGNNNFVCNCPLKDFVEYLIDVNNSTSQNLPILIDYKSNDTSYSCMDASLSKTVLFADTNDYCTLNNVRYWLSTLQHGIYIGSLIAVCGISLGSLIYWKWWYIRYIAVLIKNATVLSMINIENCEDRIYIYDIFVSYSDENRNWVIEELIPNIEGPDARFTICLHERDFQVGVSILENIIMGMDQSRTILLILSGCFLKSQWCQFEMHLAQHRLLETCREELVLVLLEEIPRRKRPKILQYLMMVKTYIVWPKDKQDTAARNLFWKRLRRAITANKSKKTSTA